MTRRRSITFLATAAVLLLSAVAVAGCGGGGATAHASPPKIANGQPATVGVANNLKLGEILVDLQGRTLYLFQKDSGTTSSCTGACAAAWPPLRSSGNPVVLDAANASLVGTTARPDGKPQATYNGHPLYSFVMDTKSDDTNGEGLTSFGGTWFAVSPAGNSVLPPAPAAPKPHPTPKPKPQPQPQPTPTIPQGNGGDHDSDNNGGPDDGDGGI
jgi:predicted lipoprotein with Yx(FWY)xxD motif